MTRFTDILNAIVEALRGQYDHSAPVIPDGGTFWRSLDGARSATMANDGPNGPQLRFSGRKPPQPIDLDLGSHEVVPTAVTAIRGHLSPK